MWGPSANYQCTNVELGVDYYGDDIYEIPDVTLDDCCKACSDDPNCGAFTFNHNVNNCLLKSGKGES